MASVAYAHIDDDGSIRRAKLLKHDCSAFVTVISPKDPSDHRIIVIPRGEHNHPRLRPMISSVTAVAGYEEKARVAAAATGQPVRALADEIYGEMYVIFPFLTSRTS